MGAFFIASHVSDQNIIAIAFFEHRKKGFDQVSAEYECSDNHELHCNVQAPNRTLEQVNRHMHEVNASVGVCSHLFMQCAPHVSRRILASQCLGHEFHSVQVRLRKLTKHTLGCGILLISFHVITMLALNNDCMLRICWVYNRHFVW